MKNVLSLSSLILMMVLFSTMVSASAFLNIKVLSIEQYNGYSWSVTNYDDIKEDTRTRVNIIATNVGDSAEVMKVEAGVYQRSLIQNWYSNPVFAITGTTVPNCVVTEYNVGTNQLYLMPQESGVAEIVLTTPKVSGTSTDYGLHTQAFRHCYNTGYPIGQTDYEIHPVTIEECGLFCLPPPAPSCSDSEINGLETDINCGGIECPKCIRDYKCQNDDDCQAGLSCQNDNGLNRCKTATIMPPITPPPITPPLTCGNGVEDISETCINCPKDATGCAEPNPPFDWGILIIILGVLLGGYYLVKKL